MAPSRAWRSLDILSNSPAWVGECGGQAAGRRKAGESETDAVRMGAGQARLQSCCRHNTPAAQAAIPHAASPGLMLPPIPLGSPMQHTPRSASTSAPASKANSPFSRTTVTVSPAAELVLPQT